MDNGPTMPCPAELYKVETRVNVSTTFWEKKKKSKCHCSAAFIIRYFSSPCPRKSDRISSIRKIFDTGFEELSKSGIHLISSPFSYEKTGLIKSYL